MVRIDEAIRPRDRKIWAWVERIAIVSAVTFTVAGVGATGWLLTADGDSGTNEARGPDADLACEAACVERSVEWRRVPQSS